MGVRLRTESGSGLHRNSQTGERKSAVDSVALAKHREIEKENISKLASEQGIYEISNAAFEHEKSALINSCRASGSSLLQRDC